VHISRPLPLCGQRHLRLYNMLSFAQYSFWRSLLCWCCSHLERSKLWWLSRPNVPKKFLANKLCDFRRFNNSKRLVVQLSIVGWKQWDLSVRSSPCSDLR
jgi:hypothetical protein